MVEPKDQEKKLEQMDRLKRRADAAARGDAVFAYKCDSGERYYKIKALVSESVLRKCKAGRKWHRAAIAVKASLLVGCWSPMVVVESEEAGEV